MHRQLFGQNLKCTGNWLLHHKLFRNYVVTTLSCNGDFVAKLWLSRHVLCDILNILCQFPDNFKLLLWEKYKRYSLLRLQAWKIILWAFQKCIQKIFLLCSGVIVTWSKYVFLRIFFWKLNFFTCILYTYKVLWLNF